MKPKSLKPIAIGLPTLLAMYSYGFSTFTPDQNSSPEFTATGNASTGYTCAQYSGTAATIYRINQAYQPGTPAGWTSTLDDSVNGTLVIASATWNANTYTIAESNVNTSGDLTQPNTWYSSKTNNGGACGLGCNDADALLQ